MNKRFCLVFAALMAASVAVFAQEPAASPANPISASEKGFYAVVSGAESIRMVMMGRRLDAARSTSLPTCGDEVALPDSTSTRSFASEMAWMISSAYRAPGTTSRGAIQQRNESLSNA